MKKFLAVMLMLMMLCVAGCDGKKAEGAGAFTGDVVILNETLGKPISDKSTYTLEEDGAYAKVVDGGMIFSCKEVNGKITSMMLSFNQLASYGDAMSIVLKMMAEYADDYNDGVYFGYSKEFFVTRYKGNNTVAALVAPNGNHWTVAFTYQKLSKEGSDYIKYIEE